MLPGKCRETMPLWTPETMITINAIVIKILAIFLISFTLLSSQDKKLIKKNSMPIKITPEMNASNRTRVLKNFRSVSIVMTVTTVVENCNRLLGMVLLLLKNLKFLKRR